MEDVIPLPVEEHRPPGRKRPRRARLDPDQERLTRGKHAGDLALLAREDPAVRRLEELVFGAQDTLLHRLQEEQPGALLLEEEQQEEKEQEKEQQQEEKEEKEEEEKEEEEKEQQQEKEEEQQQEEKEKEKEKEEEEEEQPAAAWRDEDDEQEEEVDMTHRYRRNLIKGEAEKFLSNQKLQQRMREQFQRAMGGTPGWAQSDKKKKKKNKKKKKKAEEEQEEEEQEEEDEDDEDEEDEEEEDDLLRRTGNFVTSSDRLPSGILRVKRCRPANGARPCAGGLSSVQFHPCAQVVLAAGADGSLSLFQLDGRGPPPLQSLVLEGFPVHRAQFCRRGAALVATGRRHRRFYLYDMMAGRLSPVHAVRGLNEARVKEFSVCPDGETLLLSGTNGYLHLLTLKTLEVVRSLKLNGPVSGVAFSPDGGKVFSNSEDGEVYVWDVRAGRCLHRFHDDGCVVATAIAASPDGRYLACGARSGVVNVYSQEACLASANPRPLRALKNLLTPATCLAFNPHSELLAMASRAQDEAVRMVHLPSLCVFSNFPVPSRKGVFRTSSMDFSPHSGFFSLANNKGHAPLFRLLHYKDF